ncbi:hypothetical protein E3H47_15055 (plasmid) [Acinetobacter radioresistens]|uniref:hypothetical protein n=1 Tax=Acinetobacter radioresistens TaxID=40216 RepID=UPI0010CD2990|nr:hypothetical protein [Acinetobacter radioresistens]QCS13827.1 hypothetical protein E3H47_15055 [Acinetobacter radioresistens]
MMGSNAIIIGEDEQHPLVEISVTDSKQEKEYKKIPFLDALSNIASVAAQAAPALMTAAEVANKHIMEVVIHGDLAKAADGNGLRAFSRATNGKFTEHARLYHADSLSNLVNAAAVWQIASVVVAQKHLADINRKLEDLQNGVNRISDFQHTERKTRILAIFDSLKEKIEFLTIANPEQRKGILNASILSKYDDDLKQIYLHLKADLEKYGLQKVEHKEMFGTADLKVDIEKKVKEVNELAELAFLCLSLRLICCHFMDHLGDMDSIKELIQQRIVQELENLTLLNTQLKESITSEINSMNSWVNRAQKTVSDNKGKIATSLLTVGLGPVGGLASAAVAATAAAVTGSAMDQKSKKQPGILDKRKQELLQTVEKFSANFTEKSMFAKAIAEQGIQALMAKEPPIKLAFQKLDDQHLLCLNTGEKIAV